MKTDDLNKRLDECLASFTASLRTCILSAVNADASPESREDAEEKAPVRIKEEVPEIDEVRRSLAALSKAGYRDKVKNIICKYSDDGTLSGIDFRNYPVMMREVKWNCRDAVTADEVNEMVSSLENDGFASLIPSVLEHHGAASVSDVKPEHWPSLMRDLEGLRYE